MEKKATTATEPANHIAVFQETTIRRVPALVANRGTTCTPVKMSTGSAA